MILFETEEANFGKSFLLLTGRCFGIMCAKRYWDYQIWLKSSYLNYLILANSDYPNNAEDMFEVASLDASLSRFLPPRAQRLQRQ